MTFKYDMSTNIYWPHPSDARHRDNDWRRIALCRYLVRLPRALMATRKVYLVQEMTENTVAWSFGMAVSESPGHFLVSCLGGGSKRGLRVYPRGCGIPVQGWEVCLLWESHYSVNEWLARWESGPLTPRKTHRGVNVKESWVRQWWVRGDLIVQSIVFRPCRKLVRSLKIQSHSNLRRISSAALMLLGLVIKAKTCLDVLRIIALSRESTVAT